MKERKQHTIWLFPIFLTLSMGVVTGTSVLASNHTVLISTYAEASLVNSQHRLPQDWELKVWAGSPEIQVVQESKETVLRLRSHQSCISFYKKMEIDLTKHPVLSWEWKVTSLPKEADARIGERDDQAAGIYVVFPQFLAFMNSRIIGYVWDSSVPEGTILESQNNSQVHYIVVRNGNNHLGRWISETRDVLADYRNIYGEEPPEVGGVSLMIDSDHTGSTAESFFGKIQFKHHSENMHVEKRPEQEFSNLNVKGKIYSGKAR